MIFSFLFNLFRNNIFYLYDIRSWRSDLLLLVSSMNILNSVMIPGIYKQDAFNKL